MHLPSTPWRIKLSSFLALAALLAAPEAAALAWPGTAVAHPGIGLAWTLLVAGALLWLADGTLRQSTLRFRALDDLSRRLSHPLEMSSILEAGLNHAIQIAGAEAGCLRVLDQGELVIAVTYNARPQYIQNYHKVPVDDPETARMLESQAPVCLPGGPMARSLGELVVSGIPQYAVVVPLISKSQAQGLLTLVYKEKQPVGQADLDALQAIGNQLGVAIANGQVYDGLLRESRTDPLTGLGSRRHFEDLLRREVARSKRIHRPISLAMIDVDAFKAINDTWGHRVGDQVLRAVGELLLTLRAGDVVARLGGDEFVILMPETTLDQSQRVVQRVRERLRKLNELQVFPFPVQLSIGVRQMSSPDDDLVAEADAAMYEDKRSRRAARDPSPKGHPAAPAPVPGPIPVLQPTAAE